MEPKEKAIKLLEKFHPMCDYHDLGRIHYAKQCALICVQEIDNAIDFDWMEVQNLEREHAYWESVKQEIIKL